MQVKYVGPFDAVEFNYQDGFSVRAVEAVKGQPVEVPDAVGRNMLEQAENWSRVDTKKGGDK